MRVAVFEENERCEFEGCKRPARRIACGRYMGAVLGHPIPACYCDEHLNMAVEEGEPEIITECPNCKCLFGVKHHG